MISTEFVLMLPNILGHRCTCIKSHDQSRPIPPRVRQEFLTPVKMAENLVGYARIMCPKGADTMANRVDPGSLIWVHTVCTDLSFWKLRIITDMCFRVWLALKNWRNTLDKEVTCVKMLLLLFKKGKSYCNQCLSHTVKDSPANIKNWTLRQICRKR